MVLFCSYERLRRKLGWIASLTKTEEGGEGEGEEEKVGKDGGCPLLPLPFSSCLSTLLPSPLDEHSEGSGCLILEVVQQQPARWPSGWSAEESQEPGAMAAGLCRKDRGCHGNPTHHPLLL